MRKQLRSMLILILCLSAALCGAQMQDKVYKGKWKGNKGDETIIWQYDSKTKRLMIAGKGKMAPADEYDNAHPWKKLTGIAEIGTLTVGGKVSRVADRMVWGTPAGNITRLELSDKVKEIGECAFEDTYQLNDVKLSSGLEKIGKQAFLHSGLKKIKIPSKVKKVEYEAFYKCRKLKKAIVSEGVEVLGKESFSDCYALADVWLPDSLRVLEEDCFHHTGLTQVMIPENVERIESHAFWTTKISGDTSFKNKLRRVIIKSEKIKYWGEDIFGEGSKDLVIEVPKSRLKEYREQLYARGLPKYVDVVAYKANRYEGKWENEQGKKTINWQYDSRTKTMEITGEGRMASLYYDCHPWRKLIRRVEIDKITVGGKVSRIAPDMVWGTGGHDISSLELSENVKEIGRAAFYETKNLKYVHLPSGLVKIGKEAFQYSGLEKITIPSGVKKIGADAFSYTGLREITIPGGIKKIEEGVFFYCEELKKAIVSEGIHALGYACFSDCYRLSEVRLPKSLRVIKDYAFCRTGLKKITIPENVERIEERAFDSTFNQEKYPDFKNNLRRVIIKSKKITYWGKDIFGEANKDLVIEVPKSKLKEYRKQLYSKGLPKYVKVVASK